MTISTSTKQDEELMVRAAVEKYVSGIYEGDIPKLRDAFFDSATMNGYLGDQLLEGTPEPFFQDIESKPSLKAAGANFEAHIEHLSITNNVASAILRQKGFGPFNFTDYLHLLKKDGEWKIISKTFTTC